MSGLMGEHVVTPPPPLSQNIASAYGRALSMQKLC